MSVNDNRTLFRVLAPSLRRWTWEASSVYVLSSLSEIDCFAGCLFCQSAEVTSIDSSCCCGVATLVALSWPNTERGFNALGVAEDVIFSCRLELLSSVAAPADTTGVDVALPSPSKRKSSSTCAMNGCLCKMSNEKTRLSYAAVASLTNRSTKVVVFFHTFATTMRSPERPDPFESSTLRSDQAPRAISTRGGKQEQGDHYNH